MFTLSLLYYYNSINKALTKYFYYYSIILLSLTYQKQRYMITVTDYSLTIDGMKLTMSAANETYVFTNCPKEACQVLKEAGLIEDFTFDKNGEPVILYTDKNEPQGYSYELWCDFVRSFPNMLRVGQMIIDAMVDSHVAKRNALIINRMLSPLKHAA